MCLLEISGLIRLNEILDMKEKMGSNWKKKTKVMIKVTEKVTEKKKTFSETKTQKLHATKAVWVPHSKMIMI